MAGLYLHIPFCKQACHYCDFHFSTDQSLRDEMTQAMIKEMIIQSDYLKEPIESIYMGGGTPSLLNGGELAQLLAAASSNLPIAKGAEITLEANPDDLSIEKLELFRKSGINRLSIGIQSFDDGILKFLNRAHDAAVARKALRAVRSTGFDNVSIDLIYSIPGLDAVRWEETLREAIDFAPVHISSYSLTIEERTVFGNWSKHGKFHPVDDELAATQFEMLMDSLEAAGYNHYEISNFAKPGFESKHNSSYWKNKWYLGIGPGAHSFNGLSRQFNARNNSMYIRSISKGIAPIEKEVLTSENKINEYILTSLRTSLGCDLNFLGTLGDDIRARCDKYLSFLQSEKLAILDGEILRLTRKGKLLADKIAEDLMISTP
jgi:oxygen-independent coproporphyrinogen-3 oxidase